MKVRRLYLHVGMDKTGTSAIQNFMFQNREQLLKNYALFYPRTGIWSDFSHHELAFNFLNSKSPERADQTPIIQQLLDETRHHQRVALSSELFFKIPAQPHGQHYLHRIIDQFEECQVIIGLRRQDDWVESRYKHSIYSGKYLSLDELQKPHYCDYMHWIKYWISIVGVDNVNIINYEKEYFHENGIEFSFLKSLDINDSFLLINDNIKNRSFGNYKIEIKRIFVVWGLNNWYNHSLNKKLAEIELGSDIPKNRARLISRAGRVKLLRRYEDVNRIISKTFFGTNHDFTFDVAPHPNESHWNSDNDFPESTANSIVKRLCQSDPQLWKHLVELARSVKEQRLSNLERLVRRAVLHYASLP